MHEGHPQLDAKAERLVGELRTKVWMIEDFAERALQLPPDADPDAWLKGIWSETFQSLPVEVQRAYEEQEVIHERIDELEENLEKLEEGDSAWTEAYEAIEEAHSSLERIGGSLQYPELLHALKQIEYTHAKKRKRVQEVSTDPKEAAYSFRQDTNESIDPAEILRVDKPDDDPYSVIIYRKQAPAYPGVSGLYYPKTPFIVVRTHAMDAPGLGETVRHEQMHNATDGILPIGDLADLFFRDLRYARTRLAQNLDPAFLQEVFNVERYIHRLHGEVVAAIEFAVDGDFGRNPARTERERIVQSLIAPYQENDDWSRYVRAFRTAGRYMKGLMSAIRYEISTHPGTAMEDRLQAFAEEMRERFLQMGRELEKAYKLVPDSTAKGAARRELHTLACLLTPMKYRHLATYVSIVGNKMGTKPEKRI